MINKIDNNTCSFGARFRARTFVLQRGKENEYFKKAARIIEFDVNDIDDIHALQGISTNWAKYYDGKLADFSGNIADDAEVLYNRKYVGDGKHRIFGITTQKDDYKKVDISKVLGLAEYQYFPRYSKNDKNVIVFFQTCLNNAYKEGIERKIKHVGTSLLAFIRKFSPKDIKLRSLEETLPFYKKQAGVYVDDREVTLKKIF